MPKPDSRTSECATRPDPVMETPVRAEATRQSSLSLALEQALARPPNTSEPDDRYVNLGVLATGGLGTVHAVRDRLLRRDIAVKRLNGKSQKSLRALFLREARVLAGLDHPGIIPVYDYGLDSLDQPYIVMRRIEGEDLGRYLQAVGPPRGHADQLMMLRLMRRVCEAVSFAHGRGLLHNDLKPSNLMLGDHGEVYVVDWGNAVPRSRWRTGLRSLSGTPGYLSPEQARGEPLSPRSDVFGLGACLYALLLGESPRSRSPRVAIREARDRRPIAPPPRHQVPASLLELALRAMAPDPADRPATVLEFADQLDRIRFGTWMAPTVRVAAGADVVRRGERGDQAYVVEEGQLEVLDAHGQRVEVMESGDVFGELAPLTRGVRTHSVRALSDCTLAVIDGAHLREMLELGNLGGRFVRALIERLLGRTAANGTMAGSPGRDDRGAGATRS